MNSEVAGKFVTHAVEEADNKLVSEPVIWFMLLVSFKVNREGYPTCLMKV